MDIQVYPHGESSWCQVGGRSPEKGVKVRPQLLRSPQEGKTGVKTEAYRKEYQSWLAWLRIPEEDT